MLLIFSVGVMIPYYVLEEWQTAKPVLVRLKSLSPFASMLSVVQPQRWLASGERFAGVGTWAYTLILAVAGSGFCSLFLLFKIRKPPSVKPRERVVLVSGAVETIKRKLKFPFYLIDPMRRKRQISRLVNCIFEKERRTHLLGGATYIVRTMYVSLIVSICLVGLSVSEIGIQHLDYLVAVAMAFQLGMVILVVPSLTAGSITSEIETRNLDMLRMTPLRPWTVISGKIQYALIMLVLLLLSMVPIWYMLSHLGAVNTNLIPAAAILGATVLFAVSTGIACSAFSRRTSAATAVTYGIVLAVSVGTLLPAFLGDAFQARARNVILSMNPLAASVQVMAYSMFKDLPELWRDNLKFLIGISLAFLVAATIRMRVLMKQER
jgi:ABC-type transport system involved in multi-copper enzyme maturation permease subunit